MDAVKKDAKCVVILGDGMPDYPIAELGGKTPLAYARTPNMDKLVRRGEMGTVRTVPMGMLPGSDVANLSILGYDPQRYYTGRAPIEAVAMGVELAEEDVAFRCNLVTLSNEKVYEYKNMLDYSAGEISTAEAQEIMKDVGDRLGNIVFNYYPGVSYRHLMVWRGGPEPDAFKLTPPHDITGEEIAVFLPQGENAEVLQGIMEESSTFLPDHPVNKKRAALDLPVANSLWFWGEGKKPRLDSFAGKYGLEGAVISAVDLIKGLGLLAGLEAVDVPGATGNINTDFRGKAQKALEKLREGLDFIFVHVEAPDEAGHHGDLQAKIKAIEEIDEKVVGEVMRGLDEFADYRLLVLADHPTPLILRTHTEEPVPFCMYNKGEGLGESLSNRYGEFSENYVAGGIYIEKGHTLMGRFLGR